MSEMETLVERFKLDGYVVVPAVLSADEVQMCRAGLHADLAALGIEHGDFSDSSRDRLLDLQCHSSGALPFYYSPWRLKHCACNLKLWAAVEQIWAATYVAGAAGFECPHRWPAGSAVAYLDAVGYRLPTIHAGPSERLGLGGLKWTQRALGAHIDISPSNPWGAQSSPHARKLLGGQSRWRPMQGFVSLTDSRGGVVLCAGFHNRFDEYFGHGRASNASAGTADVRADIDPEHTRLFNPLGGKQHRPIHRAMRPVEYSAGDAVLWDMRLPHGVTPEHSGHDTREVVYTSFLPPNEPNRRYAAAQYSALCCGRFPPDQQFGTSRIQRVGDGVVPGWRPDWSDSLDPAQLALLEVPVDPDWDVGSKRGMDH